MTLIVTLTQELDEAQECRYVMFYTITHKIELHHNSEEQRTKHTIFIQFSEHVCNSKIDKIVRYVERTYAFGVTNRDFDRKTLTAVQYVINKHR